MNEGQLNGQFDERALREGITTFDGGVPRPDSMKDVPLIDANGHVWPCPQFGVFTVSGYSCNCRRGE